MNINQMIAVMQLYIKCRTNKDIPVSIDPVFDLPKLITAYTVAEKWLKLNTNFYERF